MEKPTGFFYGWVIVAMSVVSSILVYGIRNSFAVFFPYILDEFGWERGRTAIMLSLNILIYGSLAPVAGSLADRWKPRKVLLIGLTILGLATAGCSLAQNLLHFYILFGILMPLGNAFCGWPLMAPALSNWFIKRRGLVIGLGQMGAGLSFIYAMFAEFVIQHIGWRYAYVVLSGTLFALILPLYLFFHYRPESKALRPYGSTETPFSEGPALTVGGIKHTAFHDYSLRQSLGTYQLWLLSLSFSLYWGLGNYLVLAHQVKFAEDIGYSSMFSASIVGLFGIFMVAGQISGFISDKIGREKALTIATLFSIGALVALISVKDTSQPILLFLYATCFGYGSGLFASTFFASAVDIFHGRYFGEVAGLLLTGQGIGGAIGPWLGGYIYDISGSYSMGFVICMICFGLACIMVWIAAPRKAARP